MKMKRMTALVMAALMAFSMAGCGKKDIESTSSKKDTSKASTSAAASENDKDSSGTDAESSAADAETKDGTSSAEESKTDSKTESKADSKTDSKADSKSDSKTDSKADSKTDSKTESKADSKTDSKTESKADSKTDSQTASADDSTEAADWSEGEAIKDDENPTYTDPTNPNLVAVESVVSALYTMASAYQLEKAFAGEEIPDCIISVDSEPELYEHFKEYADGCDFTIEFKNGGVARVWAGMEGNDGEYYQSERIEDVEAGDVSAW